MRRCQLAIAYPEGDAKKLYRALLSLKRSRCLNISAFFREAIAEKLERREHMAESNEGYLHSYS